MSRALPSRLHLVGHLLGHLVGAATLVCLASVAHAQDGATQVRAGWDAIQDADFEAALRAFDAADASHALSRADLTHMLEGRAHVHFALSNEAALEDALAALASVSPQHRFAPETPPDLVARFASASQTTPALRVTAEITVSPGGDAVVDATLGADPAHVVRGVRVAARLEDGPWQRADNEPLHLALPRPDARLAYYAEAHGPGGATVASDGSEAAPRFFGEAEQVSEEPPWGWIALGAGLGAAILTAVIVGVAVSQSGSGLTQPSPPTFP